MLQTRRTMEEQNEMEIKEMKPAHPTSTTSWQIFLGDRRQAINDLAAQKKREAETAQWGRISVYQALSASRNTKLIELGQTTMRDTNSTRTEMERIVEALGEWVEGAYLQEKDTLLRHNARILSQPIHDLLSNANMPGDIIWYDKKERIAFREKWMHR